MACTIVERRWRDADVGGGSAKYLDRCRQRLPATDALDDERITGAGELAGRPFAADQHRVGALPGRSLLPSRQREAGTNEPPGGEVELAQRHRIFTAVGQADHAPALRRLIAVGTAPEPVRLLRLGQRVEVEHRCPFRRGCAVVGKPGPTPYSAHAVIVLPEIRD